MDHFGTLFLVITLVGIIVAMVGVRIPPISKYPNTYMNNSEISPLQVTQNESQSKIAYAFDRALQRADKVTPKHSQ